MESFEAQYLMAHYCKSFLKFMRLDISANFKDMYVTHNLRDTMYTKGALTLCYIDFRGNEFKENGKLMAKFGIPAVRYDMKRWEEDMIVVHIPEKGSYANEVNITGGWSPKKVHLGYIEEAIANSILQAYHSTKREKRKIADRSVQFKLKGVIWK